MSQIRFYLESTDGTDNHGYILPIGAELISVDSLGQKQRASGLGYTPNEPLTISIEGTATNNNVSPTDAQIVSATQALTGFLTNNEELKFLKILQHDGSNPLGGSVSPTPGATIQTYEPAYSGPGFARWEVLNYSVSNIIYPNHFDFAILLQNVPLDDADRYNIGALRLFDAAINRTVTNGIEQHDIVVMLGLPPGYSITSALTFIDRLLQKGGTLDVATSTEFGTLSKPAASTLSHGTLSRVFEGAKVRLAKYSYDNVKGIFTATITAQRPLFANLKQRGFEDVLAFGVEIVIDVDDGVVTFDRKKRGAKRLAQRARNESAIISLKIDVICHGRDLDDFQKIIDGAMKRAGNVSSWVRRGYIASRKSGNVSVNFDEMENVYSVLFKFEPLDTKEIANPKTGKGLGLIAGSDKTKIVGLPAILSDAFSTAVLTAMIGEEQQDQIFLNSYLLGSPG